MSESMSGTPRTEALVDETIRAVSAVTDQRKAVGHALRMLGLGAALMEIELADANTALAAERAQVARLREALHDVLQLQTLVRAWQVANRIPGWQNADTVFEAARAALSEEGRDEKG